jgi:fatty acid desaturase
LRAGKTREVEWPTLLAVALTYAVWALALFWLPTVSLWLAIPVLALAGAQHSSLTHEMCHGHPFRHQALNAWLVALPLTVFIPYLRFKDTHLAHHHDEILTDPYDDTESNFYDPAVWVTLSAPFKALLQFNNTLLGRMTVGPILGMWAFLGGDIRAMLAGDRRVQLGWALQVPSLAVLFWIVAQSPTPIWAYFLATHNAIGLLKIRTFLEHRAHEKARARTVVVEDRGPLSILFLNNNYHAVHHMHPKVAWYRLPALYASRRDHYLGRNEGYRYASYAEVFRRYFLRAKDPVPHPLWSPEVRVSQGQD